MSKPCPTTPAIEPPAIPKRDAGFNAESDGLTSPGLLHMLLVKNPYEPLPPRPARSSFEKRAGACQ